VKIPFIDLSRQTALVKTAALRRWEQSVDASELVGGASVLELEAELGKRLGVAHVVTCASGTDALRIGLQTLGVGPGSRVALPALTFWATYEAVAQLGATAVLVDVDAEDLQLDLDELALAFDEFAVDAVVQVHLMGWASARLQELRRFCAEREIALLEDGAQAFGVELGGRSVYAGAPLSTLSFFPAKVLGGCMDGGAILTDDAERAERARRLCNHGRSAHFAHAEVGWSSRLGALGAGWLLEMLAQSDAILAERRRLHDRWLELLAGESGSIRMHRAPAGVTGNGYLSVCELVSRDPDRLAAELTATGVGTGRVYPATIDMQPPARRAPRVSGLERAHAFCRRVIDLPLFYGMTEDELALAHESFVRLLRSSR
jgi:UDP-2-acetamido-2-deoxy-ribo-hexuluronate aminotransferase